MRGVARAERSTSGRRGTSLRWLARVVLRWSRELARIALERNRIDLPAGSTACTEGSWAAVPRRRALRA
jgi:hypothetical protein